MNLKFFFLSLTALLSFSLCVQAQDSIPTKSTLSFKLGGCYMPQSTFIQNTSEKKDPSASPEWQLGFMIGITTGVVFSKKVSLDLGFGSSKQGVNYSTSTEFYAPITLHYLKIPITLNYRPLMKYNIPFEFSGGFQYSGLLKADIYMRDGYYLPNNGDKQWFNESTFDVVGAVGTNFEILQHIYVNLKCRADYSLTDPINRDYTFNGGGNTIMHWKSDRSPSHNITVGFLMGIEYHFGKK
ncbi:MAG: outer membrane beta-barrel protein [Cytophaga sp.]|uniref:outer membrane beta-barrel protein n=1 Tax=Cytophaga sp. TaxID=29535 RepID=UPI003F7E3B1B